MYNAVSHPTDSVNQEIILHTLFESGITGVGDLERYIQDDVVRYGGRLAELGKKLDNAYQEIVSPTKLCLLHPPAHNFPDERRRCYRRRHTLWR